MNIFSSKNPAKPANAGLERRYQVLGFRIMGEFGATIAAPVVILAWLGKKLDQAYGTGPWLLIAGFTLAFAFSAATIYRRSKAYGREYEELEKKYGVNNK